MRCSASRPTLTPPPCRLAYRRALRTAHPDTGGDPSRFHAVQLAWELVGTPEARAAFDRGARGGAPAPTREAWAPAAPTPRRDSRPLARSYGHPGGLSRERYLSLVREWAGRGVTVDDPYDPVARAGCATGHPPCARRRARRGGDGALAVDARHRLHGLARPGDGCRGAAASRPKLDHLVLGPTGLFAIQSEDWGGQVAMKRGELIGEALDGERPIRALAARAKAIGRAARVKPTALVIVVPDEHAAEPLQLGGTNRGAVVALVRRSRLMSAIREGLPGLGPPRRHRGHGGAFAPAGRRAVRLNVASRLSGGAFACGAGAVLDGGMPHLDTDAYLADFADFVTASPSSYHAAAEVARRLEEAGFERLDEAAEWPATPGRRVVVRDGAVIAWVQPRGAAATTPYRMLGAHTDSPSFKLKPAPTVTSEGFLQAGVEVYGGPLLNSWLDRELELAGRIVTADGAERLVRTGPMLRIPQLAIHLDREINSGLSLDKQRHMQPVWGVPTRRRRRPARVARRPR